MRNLGWISYRAGGGKTNNIETFWPIGKPKPTTSKVWGDTPEEARANYEAIMKAHKIK